MTTWVKGAVAEFYKDFDEMGRKELVVHLEGSRGFACAEDATVDELRTTAWNDYAQELGLEYHDDSLMQYGDGGYPYIYVVPADGGDVFCHECATKELKKGESVAWSHHMEGGPEICCGCSNEIVPFVKPEVHVVEWEVRLRLRILSTNSAPRTWDWEYLLDLADGESYEVEKCEVRTVCACTHKRTVSGNICTDCNLPVRALSDLGDVLESIKPTVTCKFCHQAVPAGTAHRHDGSWVGDECCWDERLRSTE